LVRTIASLFDWPGGKSRRLPSTSLRPDRWRTAQLFVAPRQSCPFGSERERWRRL